MSFQGCINHIQIGHENPVKGERFILFFKSRRFCEVLQTDPMGMMMSYFVILAPFKNEMTLANLCTPVKRIYTQQIKVGIISLTTHPPYDKTANATGAYCARTA